MNGRDRRTYNHRLRELVWKSQDTTVAAGLAIPKSTLDDWLRTPPRPVVTIEVLDRRAQDLQIEVVLLRRRVHKLLAILRLLLVLLRLSGFSLQRTRLPEGVMKDRLLRSMDRSRPVVPIRAALRILGLSATRYHAWRRMRDNCGLDDHSSCPRTAPHQLTTTEVRTIREMVTSKDFRHVPTGTLAILAQRMGKVFASATTWYRLIRRFG